MMVPAMSSAVTHCGLAYTDLTLAPSALSIVSALTSVAGGVAVEDQHIGLLDAPVSDALHLPLADQLTNLDVIETDVIAVSWPAEREPVIVDHLDTLGFGVLLNGSTRLGVERIDKQHRGALRYIRFGL